MEDIIGFLPFLSLGLMFLSIVVTAFSAKKPRSVVPKAIIVNTVFQALSFFLFWGITAGESSLLWLLAGLVLGVVFALMSRFERKGQTVMYRQSAGFTVLYLALLLLNQLIALTMGRVISFALSITAAALGLQAGASIVVLIKAGKLKKNSAVTTVLIVVIFAALMASTAFTANAADEWKLLSSTSGQIGEKFYQNAPVGVPADAGVKTAVSVPGAGKLRLTAEFASDVASGPRFYGDELGYRAQARMYVYLSSGKSSYVQFNNAYDKNFSKKTMELDIDSAQTVTVQIVPQGASATANKVTSSEGKAYLYFPGRYTLKAEFLRSGNAAGGSGAQASGTQSSGSAGAKIPDTAAGSSVQINAARSGTAVSASGLLAAIGAIIASVMSMVGGGAGAAVSGSVSAAAQATAAKSAAPPAPKPADTSARTPEAPRPQRIRPANGERNSEGLIYTQLHGYINEDLPQIQINSIKKLIELDKAKIDKYTKNPPKGHNYWLEISNESLQRHQRELKQWEFSNAVVQRTLKRDDLAGLEASNERWQQIYSNQDRIAAIYSSGAQIVGFGADVALTVISGPASKVLQSGARNLLTRFLGKASSSTFGQVLTKTVEVSVSKKGVETVYDVGKSVAKGDSPSEIAFDKSVETIVLKSADKSEILKKMIRKIDDTAIMKKIKGKADTFIENRVEFLSDKTKTMSNVNKALSDCGSEKFSKGFADAVTSTEENANRIFQKSAESDLEQFKKDLFGGGEDE